MFGFFSQYVVSYTPSFSFRPYYPYFQTSEIHVFTWVSFRITFFSFPSLFYHHSSFSIADLQRILKLGSYLFLILLFLDSSIFPDEDLRFFSTYTCQPLSPLGLFTVSPLWKYTSVSHLHFCTLLWYFWSPVEVVLHAIPHSLGTDDKRVNKGEKGARETCSFEILTLNLWLWAASRNVVNEMISIHCIWLLSYSFFFPHGFFFFNSLHSVHCCSLMLLLEWELRAGNSLNLWYRLRSTLYTHKQTILLQHNWNSFKKNVFGRQCLGIIFWGTV